MAPLPKDSVDPMLTRMLASAPYQVPAGKDKEESGESQGGLSSGGTPGNFSGEIGTSTFDGGREGQTDIPSPHGKKRTASEDLKREASKRGKVSQSRGDVDMSSLCKHRPSAES